MKILFFLMSISLINKDCSPQMEQEHISIEYTESTRGSYLQVQLKNNVITIYRERSAAPIIKEYPEAAWYNLLMELKKIKIDQLQNFKIPSENHHVDGAKIAFLKITKNNKIHQSKNFDHNNPPKEVAVIVKEILSIVENID
ncbi:hypothetical protein [Algibacter sp.]|uniref:hypothetical protein n=1 Tax=Algibacter sp. TaxID=1872428 RepID=UPI003C716118